MRRKNSQNEDLIKGLSGIRLGFLFNLDKSGQQDYVEAMETYVIYPSNMQKGVFIPACRAARRYSLAEISKTLHLLAVWTYSVALHYLVEGVIRAARSAFTTHTQLPFSL